MSVRWFVLLCVVLGVSLGTWACGVEVVQKESIAEESGQGGETSTVDGGGESTPRDEVAVDRPAPDTSRNDGGTQDAVGRDVVADEVMDQPPVSTKAPTKLAWAKRYGGDNAFGGQFMKVIPASQGSVIVLGHPYAPFLARYDRQLKQTWYKKLPEIELVSLAVDAQDNAIACGTFKKSFSVGRLNFQPKGGDGVIVKFDAKGSIVLVRVFSTGRNSYGACSHVVLGDNGEFYIAGSAYRPFSIGLKTITPGQAHTRFIAKLDAKLEVVWSQTFRLSSPGFFSGPEMSVQRTTNGLSIFASYKGKLEFGNDTLDTTTQGIALLKMDLQGKPLSLKELAKDGALREAIPGPGQSWLVTGWFNKEISFLGTKLTSTKKRSVFVLQMSDDRVTWSQKFESSRGLEVGSLTFNRAGGVYLAGRFTQDVSAGNQTLSAPSGGFMAYVERGGSPKWIKLIDTSLSNEYTTPKLALVMIDQSPLLIGNFRGRLASPKFDIFSQKGAIFFALLNERDPSQPFDPIVQTGGQAGQLTISQVTHNAKGETIVAGVFGGSVKWGDSMHESGLFVAMVDEKGEPGWLALYKSKVGGRIDGLLSDGKGGFYLHGALSGATNFGRIQIPAEQKFQFFLARLDASGQAQWVKGYGSANNVHMAVDSKGHLRVAGSFGGTLDFDGKTIKPNQQGMLYGSLFVASLDGDGKGLWARHYDGPYGGKAGGLMLDSSDHAYVVGIFNFILLNSGGKQVLRAGNGPNGLLMKHSPSGGLVWARSFNGGSSTSVAGVLRDGVGRMWVGGGVRTAAQFGSIKKTPVGPSGFLAQFDSAGRFTALSFHGKEIQALGRYGKSFWVSGVFDAQKSLTTKEGTLTTREESGFVALAEESGALLWGVPSGPLKPQVQFGPTGSMFLFHKTDSIEVDLGQTSATLTFRNDNVVAKFVQP